MLVGIRAGDLFGHGKLLFATSGTVGHIDLTGLGSTFGNLVSGPSFTAGAIEGMAASVPQQNDVAQLLKAANTYLNRQATHEAEYDYARYLWDNKLPTKGYKYKNDGTNHEPINLKTKPGSVEISDFTKTTKDIDVWVKVNGIQVRVMYSPQPGNTTINQHISSDNFSGWMSDGSGPGIEFGSKKHPIKPLRLIFKSKEDKDLYLKKYYGNVRRRQLEKLKSR